MSKQPRIVMLAGGDVSTHFIYNALSRDYAIDKLIIERPVPRSTFLLRRVKNLGLLTVAGQLLFMLGAQKILRLNALVYREELQYRLQLDERPPADSAVRRVESVNAAETIQLLQELRPELIIVNGTRILSKRALESVDAVFINLHTGITPLYRGVHGGYWALAERDPEHCGVTIHLIDPGIDTGGILRQARIRPGPRDNFTTYPLLQVAEGIALIKDVIEEFSRGPLQTLAPPAGPSRLWSHPTLFQYLYHYLRHGVK